MGKGWAKGLTAATDPRIAARAEAHRGKRYVRRKQVEECKWPLAGRTTLPLQWSEKMAYIVGLTATDGCLVSGRRQVNFKSIDRELVETYLALLGRTNRVHERKTPLGRPIYVAQFGDAALYRWFMSIGLTPRKSLTLGAIAVPDAYLLPLARGLLDGDGTILNKVYRADTARRSDYYWEYLLTRFTSASRPHLEWIATSIEAATGVSGYLQEARTRDIDRHRHPFFHLRYGKRASLVLLPLLYPSGAPCLERKRAIWLAYAERHGLSPYPIK
ncbi:MAG TPA: LAGLIDADG family homing endonuclease [Candidatus Limnocylindria bacterium]